MAHGFGQTRQAWQATAQGLRRAGYASLAFDARGHGQSDRNPVRIPYRHEQFVDDIVAAARTLPPAPVLVGASMGGLVGLMAQARAPVFSALVLVDITPRWRPEGVARILDFMSAHPDGFDDYDHAAAAIAGHMPHRPRKSAEQLACLLVRCERGRLRWHWDPRLLDDIGRTGEPLQAALLQAAGSIDVPLLLISGGRSELVADDHIEELLELAPHAEHVRIEQATHMVAGDDNDRFTETVLEFLGRLPGSLRAANPPSPGERP